ncbi:MAG: MoaD/ThiS family protein [Chloroflexi bacterium]|jgi:molybdopterin synthase sulfur carrier subunit|nr:MoaD/ThiS family protein [Chloroflexota bacterium]HLG50148.1 ubiquitin-like small modifier protein 1 [Chloroflexota bacterium]
MPVTVRIPAPLRRLTDGQREVLVEAPTVAACLERLAEAYPGLKERICEADGSVRRFVNIYVRGEDIRFSQGLDTPLHDGDDVSIVPAASGG